MLMGLIIFAIWNLTAFFLMGLDKMYARKNRWRIRERNILGMAMLLGGVGIWAGMYIFRHKTQHKTFVWGIPPILLCNAACLYYLCAG